MSALLHMHSAWIRNPLQIVKYYLVWTAKNKGPYEKLYNNHLSFFHNSTDYKFALPLSMYSEIFNPPIN